MKKSNKLLASFYILLLVVLLSYGTIRCNQQQSNNRHVPPKPQNVITATIVAKKADPRALQVYYFLKKYDSPLQGSAVDFVEIADKYRVDWKVLVSITGVESTFGKNIAQDSFNPFGYMCKNGVCYFNSFREAIEQTAKTISHDRAYSEYRRTRQVYDLAVPYNFVHPTEWTQKIQFFIELI